MFVSGLLVFSWSPNNHKRWLLQASTISCCFLFLYFELRLIIFNIKICAEWQRAAFSFLLIFQIIFRMSSDEVRRHSASFASEVGTVLILKSDFMSFHLQDFSLVTELLSEDTLEGVTALINSYKVNTNTNEEKRRSAGRTRSTAHVLEGHLKSLFCFITYLHSLFSKSIFHTKKLQCEVKKSQLNFKKLRFWQSKHIILQKTWFITKSWEFI